MIIKTKIITQTDDDETKLMLSRACDLYSKAHKTGVAFFTKFLSPPQSATVFKRFPKNELSLSSFGGYDDAERRLIAFHTYDEPEFPIAILKIRPKSKTASLSHRDYLGSVLSLGIKRETIGDIVVGEDFATMFCLDEIAEFIMENLLKVANVGVEVTKQNATDEIMVKREFQKISATVSSLRCDSLVSEATNLARGKASELIKKGLVTLNYEQLTSVSRILSDGDVLSIRGYGKFKLQTDGRLTKKGRIFVNLLKYI